MGGRGRRGQNIRRRWADTGLLLRRVPPPLWGLVLGVGFLCARFGAMAGRLPRTADFDRSDTGQYLSIARRGYWTRTYDCHAAPHRHPHLCGNVTWFPGYPAVLRALAEITRLALPYAAIAVSWACWYVLLRQVWRMSSGEGDQRRWLCLAVAVLFPGQVYFGAIFPLSMAVGAALLGIEAAAVRGRLRTALPAGFVAGASYLAMTQVAPALLIGVLFAKGRRARLALAVTAASTLAGFGAVLLYAQLSVGRWNAYFVTESQEYGVGLHQPWAGLVHHLRPLWAAGRRTPAADAARTAAVQSVLVLAVVLVAIVVTAAAWIRDRRLAAVDAVLLCASSAAALLPYLAGGELAVYRAEGCVVLLVPLLRRAPRWLLVLVLLGCAVMAYQMAGLFHDHRLG